MVDPAHCDKNDLTGSVGWLLQGVLAGLAFTCLIGKRFREPPSIRRSWETWWYDTSKQGIGAIIIHLTNVYLAPLFQGDPCTWYVINFLLDSTIGLLIVFIGIRFCQFLAWYKKWPAINFGVYDAPKSWVYQTWIYIGLMAIVKISTTLFIQLEFWNNVRHLVLSPFSNPTIELVLIMLVIPFGVNILIFWVTDNFLMRHDHQKSNKAYHGNNCINNKNGSCCGGCSGNGSGYCCDNSNLNCSCANGSSTKTLLQRAKIHCKQKLLNHLHNNTNSNHINKIFLKDDNDSESDALISGNEDNNITDDDHIVIYDDRIALERCGIGMGSTSSIDPSSAKRNHHRSSFIVNP